MTSNGNTFGSAPASGVTCTWHVSGKGDYQVRVQVYSDRPHAPDPTLESYAARIAAGLKAAVCSSAPAFARRKFQVSDGHKAYHVMRSYPGRGADPVDVPNELRWWVDHVRGFGLIPDPRGGRRPARWEEFSMGHYTQVLNEAGETVGKTCTWDLDAAFEQSQGGKNPFVLAAEIVAKLVMLGVRPGAILSNVTQSGRGVHVHLILERPCRSWKTYLLGRALTTSLGYAPGTNPAAGQIESFPKQPELGKAKKYGNLLGLPCAMHLMLQGKTTLIDPATNAAVYDLEHTARLLESIDPLPEAELDALLRKLGIDPEKPPPKPTPVPVPGAPRRVKVGGQEIVVRSRMSALHRAVLERNPIRDLIEKEHGRDIAGTKFRCLVHEPKDGKYSASLFEGSSGFEVYKCHGDCANGAGKSSGDVVDLYAAVNGLPWRDALLALAARSGLDPASFKDRIELAPDTGLVQLPAGVVAAPKKAIAEILDESAVPLLGPWLARWAPKIGTKTGQFKLAQAVLTAYFTVEAVLTDEQKATYTRTPVALAKALEVGLPGFRDHGEWLEAISELQERFAAGAAMQGHRWVQAKLGLAAAHELLLAVGKITGRKGYQIAETLKLSRVYRNTLEGAQILATHTAIPIHDKGHEYASAGRKLRRVRFCGSFGNAPWGDGHELAKAIPMVCDTMAVCPKCAQRLVADQVKLLCSDSQDDADVTWRNRKLLYTVEVTLPSMHWADMLFESIRKSRDCRAPKFRVIGCEPTRGRIKVLWVSDDRYASKEIKGEVLAWLRNENFPDEWLETGDTTHTESVADMIYQLLLSHSARTHELLRSADHDGVKRWLAWIGKRRAVSRSRKALPWPSRTRAKTVKTEERWSPDYDGQQVTWKLQWVPTGYTLREQKDHPFTLDQAIAIAARDTVFQQHALAAEAAKQSDRRKTTAQLG